MKSYKNEKGQFHRLSGPAVVWDDGEKEWYLNGKRHRINGPAIINKDSEEWYLNGVLHRENGPAIKYKNGTERWYLMGIPHRIDGPAIILDNGFEYWYLNSKKVREEDHPFNIFRIKYNLPKDIELWSEEYKIQFFLFV